MSQDEMRRYFEAVIIAPPPDGTDVDAAIRTATHRQRRRNAVSAACAATVLVVGFVGVAAWQDRSTPDGTATGPSPSASQPVQSSPASALPGAPATSARQLYGTWLTVRLGGIDVSQVQSDDRRTLMVRFDRVNGASWWGANSGCNSHSGKFRIEDGTFSAEPGGSTLVGCARAPVPDRNPEVVPEADQARIAPAAGSEPPRLYLLRAGNILGEYVYQPTGRIHGLFELVGGPPTADGKTPHQPVAIEDLALMDGARTVLTTNTDGHGVFDIEAPAGDYTLVTARGCPAPLPVHISDQRTTRITITCPIR